MSILAANPCRSKAPTIWTLDSMDDFDWIKQPQIGDIAQLVSGGVIETWKFSSPYFGEYDGFNFVEGACRGVWVRGGSSVSPNSFGATGDGQQLIAGATMASGGTTLTAPGAIFNESDVGKVVIFAGGDQNMPYLVSTIASVSSEHVIVTTDPAPVVGNPADLTNKNLIWGTDDSEAFQRAIDALSDTGGDIFLGHNFYLVDGLIVNQERVSISGQGQDSRLYKKADTSNVLLRALGEQFQIRNVRVESVIGFLAQDILIELFNISDGIVERVWCFGGYDQLKLTFGNNHRVVNANTFESSRHHGVWVHQSSVAQISDNAFYTNGLYDDEPLNETAAIRVTKDATFAFRPHNIGISDNQFYYSRYAHFVNASEVAGLSISDNKFHLAGMFNPGSKDDIKLAACDDVTIDGNVSLSILNNYIPGNRATRYCVNFTDGLSTDVQCTGNVFEPGIAGMYNLNSEDVTILGGRTIAGSVSSPAMSLPNDRFIIFRDNANGVAACGGFGLSPTNILHILAGNSSLNGITIDPTGQVMMGTTIPLGRLTVTGLSVFGSNGYNQIYDDASSALFQSPDKDWAFFNSISAANQGYLTKAGVLTTKQFVASNTVPSAPDPNAVMDLQSTDKGFIPPRLTTVQRDAMTAPSDGIMIYNTTDGKFQGREAGAWVNLV